jgi:hypothetical protein
LSSDKCAFASARAGDNTARAHLSAADKVPPVTKSDADATGRSSQRGGRRNVQCTMWVGLLFLAFEALCVMLGSASLGPTQA